MIKLILLSCLFLFTIFSFEINNLNTTCSLMDNGSSDTIVLGNGMKYKEFSLDRNTICSSIFQNDIEVRYCYYNDSQIRSISMLQNNQNIGGYLRYYYNGNIMIKGFFSYDIVNEDRLYQDTIWIQSVEGLGEYASYIEKYTAPINGKWEYYFENGLKQFEGVYVNGKENGEWKYYNIDGELYLIRSYINGKFVQDSILTKNYFVLPPLK